MSEARKQELIVDLQKSQEFFNRSVDCLKEEDSSRCPAKGMLTAAQQISHTALSAEWFVNGAFDKNGFSMDFEAFEVELKSYTSIEAARKKFDECYDEVISKVSNATWEDLCRPLPEGPIMGGQPAYHVISGLVEHTAHHLGALTVYSRLAGHVPPMPYM